MMIGIPAWAEETSEDALWNGELWGSVQSIPDQVAPEGEITITATIHDGSPTPRWECWIDELTSEERCMACGTYAVTISGWDDSLTDDLRLYDIIDYGPDAGSEIQITLVGDGEDSTTAPSIKWTAVTADWPEPGTENPPPPNTFRSGDTFWIKLQARPSWPGWYNASGVSRKITASFEGTSPHVWSDDAFIYGAAPLAKVKIDFNPESFDIFATAGDTQDLTFFTYDENSGKPLKHYPVLLSATKGAIEPLGTGNETMTYQDSQQEGLVVYTDNLGYGYIRYQAEDALVTATISAEAWYWGHIDSPPMYGRVEAHYQPLLNVAMEPLDSTIPLGTFFPVQIQIENVSSWDLTDVTLNGFGLYGTGDAELISGTAPISIGNLAAGQTTASYEYIYQATDEGNFSLYGYVGATNDSYDETYSYSKGSLSTITPGLDVTVDLPMESPLQDQTFTLTVQVINNSSQNLETVYPMVTAVYTSFPGGPSLISGPDPSSVSILNPGAETVFTYQYKASRTGEIFFRIYAEGKTASGNRIVSETVRTDNMTVTENTLISMESVIAILKIVAGITPSGDFDDLDVVKDGVVGMPDAIRSLQCVGELATCR
ncbi:MAG: hypothetical protein JXA41_10130 [Deltaproteobacteria bacterium]|nr:hypothetical protein [Deltaproteobacteria bacterium]